ncbi:MAG TPA: vWA domain-containing protein [Isosphaeraceae bacterium]
MPAFYRMPVFYLVAILVAAAVGLGTLGRGAGTTTTASAPLRSEAPRPVTPKAEPAETPDDGILRTADGLRRKVVVKDLGVVCRSEPRAGRAVGEPLDYFAIRYVFGEAREDGRTMFRVGPLGGPPQGWIPAESVLEWDTRLMARPTPRAGRPALVIYREEPCLLDALAGRICPRHEGRCPIEGEEAPAEAAGAAGDAMAATLGLPILQSRSIPQPDGTARTVFEVASLVRDQAPPPPPPAQPTPDLLPLLRRIDIAFVIDTTASMQGTIDAARALATELVAAAADRHRDVTLRLALVEYRDAAPVYGFRARIVTMFTDPAGFRAALDRIEAARRGDGSIPEAVLDGVAVALPPPAGEPLGRAAHLDWPTGRAGELATKMLVLLGDAPDHDPGPDRARSLAALARQSGITIAAVSIDRPGVLSRDEAARYRAQWHALAEGSARPRDKASGFARPIPPIELALAEAGGLAPHLQALIDDRIEHARDLAALARAEAEGKIVEYVNSQGLTMDQVGPVLRDVHRDEPRPEARPDPRSGGRKAPSVRRGWIAERQDGRPLVSVEILMTRTELDVLIGELAQLQQAAQGTAGDLEDLLRIGTAAAAGETGFLGADRGEQTFADHLRRRQGLPPARPDSLLRRSQADLLQADDLYRAALNARLGASLDALIRRRNAPDWDDPRRAIDGLALVPYASIDF